MRRGTMKKYILCVVAAVLAVLPLAKSNFDGCQSYASSNPPNACILPMGRSIRDGTNEIFDLTVGEKRYFYFTVSSAIDEYVLSVSVLSGDADIYVTAPSQANGVGREPSNVWPYVADWHSSSTSERDVVTINDDDLVTGTYVVLVHAFRESTFTLTLSTPTEAVTLDEGIPFRDTAFSNQTELFQFVPNCQSIESCPQHITITVSALSGDPDLVVSTTGFPSRDPSTWEHRSQFIGGDATTLPVTAVGETFYIGVYAYRRQSTFQILVSAEGEPSRLLDGVAQDGNVTLHGTDYYILNTPPDELDVTISLFTLSGDVTMYVYAQNDTSAAFVEPDATNADWTYRTYAGRDTISLELLHSDPSGKFLTNGGQYNIAVVGRSAGDRSSVEYSISATNGRAITTLRDGIPHEATIAASEFEYYMLHVNDPTASVIFDLNTEQGDSDMYISCNISNTGTSQGEPSQLHHIAASISFNHDTIAVGPRWHDRSCDGTYYIAVYGFRTGQYLLTASIDDGRPVTLLDGVQQSGVIPTREPDFVRSYQFYLSSESSASSSMETMRVTVTPTYGRVKFYVATNGEPASPTNYDVSNVENGYLKSSVDLAPCSDACEVSIAVMADDSTVETAYTIVASSVYTDIRLADGVPVQDHISRLRYIYYMFEIPQDDVPDSVSIVVTPSSGDPDLTVTTRNISHPQITDSGAGIYKSRAVGEDTVLLTRDQIGDAAIVYMSVYAYSETSYSISATAHYAGEEISTVLLPGQPQQGEVSANNYTYYRFGAPSDANASLTITAVPISGDVEFFVDVCDASTPLHACPRPKTGSYKWHSEDTSQQMSLSISVGDENYCRDCQYFIGVTTRNDLLDETEDAARFSVTAVYQGDTIRLQDRMPFRASVEAHGVNYYLVELGDVGQDVYISVSALTGDPDAYFSMCSATAHVPENGGSCLTTPSNSLGSWRKSIHLGSDAATLQTASCRESGDSSPCRIYVGVYGYSASSYTIMASMHDDFEHPAMLVLGVPQHGTLGGDEIVYYAYNLPRAENYRDITVNLQALSGDSDMFITLDGTQPTHSNHDYEGYAVNSDHVIIRTTDEPFQTHCSSVHLGRADACRITIAVKAYAPSGEASYNLVVSQASDLITLQNGVPYADRAEELDYTYYQFNVEDEGPVTFTITPDSGTPMAYISTTTRRPDGTAPQHWTIAGPTFSRTIEDGCTAPCSYYVGVHGVRGIVSYTMLAQSNADSTVTTLLNGIPQSGQVLSNAMRFFQIRPLSSSGVLRIETTTTGGSIAMFVRRVEGDSTTTLLPELEGSSTCESSPVPMSCVKQDSYDYHTADGTTNSVDISTSDCTTDPCTYTIGVYGVSRSSTFSIYASSDVRHLRLREGVPVRDQVDITVYKEYVFAVVNDDESSQERDLTVTVTTFSGDADLFLSFDTPYPSYQNHTFMANSIFEDTITVTDVTNHPACKSKLDRGEPCLAFISVFGYASTSDYSIIASFSDTFRRPTVLQAGQPQAGYVRGDTYRYYSLTYAYDASNTEQDVEISVQSQSGDPDIFVVIPPHASNWTNAVAPSKTHYDFMSNAWHSDTLVIPSPNDGCSAQCGGSACMCTLSIAVYGASARVGITNSTYTIVGVVNGGDETAITQLQSGIAQSSIVISEAHDWKYFMVTVAHPDEDVTISVTPSYGDPDIYVIEEDTSDPTVRPSTSTPSPWRSRSVGADVLTLSHETLNCALHDVCHYIVGVFAYSATEFSILAQVGAADLISISDGRPQVNELDAGESKTYVMRLSNDASSIDLALTTLSGTPPVAYVKALTTTNVGDVHENPSPSSYTWATNDVSTGGSGNGLFIDADDSSMNGARVLLVTVVASSSASCQFQLSLSTQMEHTQLFLGAAAGEFHFVSKDHTEYFMLYLPDASQDLMLFLTALHGDPDMYVSRSPYPECGHGAVSSCTNISWYTRGLGNETIVIDHTDPCSAESGGVPGGNCDPGQYTAGWYFIAVFGYSDASFTLLASVANEAVLLTDGLPQAVHTSSQTPFVSMQHPEQSVILGFTLDATTGSTTATLDLMFNVDSKRENTGLEVELYACSPSSTSGLCSSDEEGKLSDMRPLERNNAALVDSFTVGPDDAAHSHMFNHSALESACADAGCQITAVVYAPSSSSEVHFRASFVKAGVRIVSVGANQAVTYPSESAGDEVSVGSSRLYELYVTKSEALHVKLENCLGRSTLLFCDSSCSNPFDPSSSTTARSGPTIDLAARSVSESTFYLEVEGTAEESTTASFQIKLGSGSASDSPSAPDGAEIQVTVNSIDSVVVSWPGPPSGQTYAYEVYRVAGTSITSDTVLDTACGMNLYNPHASEGPFVPSQDGDALSFTFTDSAFIANIEYTFVVFALSPSGDAFAYPAVSKQISGSDSGSSSSGISSSVGVIIAVVVIVVLILAAIPVCSLYRKTQALEERLQYEMQDVRNVAGVGGMRTPVVGSNADGYGKLYEDEDGLGGDFDDAALGDFAPME